MVKNWQYPHQVSKDIERTIMNMDKTTLGTNRGGLVLILQEVGGGRE